MSMNLSTSSSTDIYQKKLSEYDLNRLPHILQKGKDEHSLKRSELIDTLKTEFSCPICLDLLKNTMVTECLHRFCSECIQKSIYKANRECPTCRKKLISKRNLRADPNMDKLIDTVWPDRHLYDTMQQEKAQKWHSHTGVVALQRSIAEGMRAQAKARDRPPMQTERPTAKVLRPIENKTKDAPLLHEHDGCAAKRWCLRARRVTAIADNIEATNAQQKTQTPAADHQNEMDDLSSDSSSVDLSSTTTSSGEESSFDYSTSDGEAKENAPQAHNGLIVDVDVGFFDLNNNKNKGIDDGFIGRVNKEAANSDDVPSSNATTSTLSRQTADNNESSGFCSASSSSSPFSINEKLRLCPPNFRSDCSVNFGIVVSMESALREYVSKTGQLGLITIELVPLPEHRPLAKRCRVKLMHWAKVEELRAKLMNTQNCLAAGAQFSFFVRTYDNQMTRLHTSESMCTVITLAKRTNFFDYPTVFFTADMRPLHQ